MSNRSLVNAALALALLAIFCRPIAALTFQDSFDDEPGGGDGASGLSGLNYASFANWTVDSGTVDLISSGDFNIGCANGVGKCVDLDGSTSDAGLFVSTPLLLSPGTYILSFELAGAPSSFGGSAATPNFVDVSVGAFYSEQIERQQGDPFETFGGEFFVTEPTTVSIVFDNPGDDNFGALLDNLALRAPEPGIFALLGTGAFMLLVTADRQRLVDDRRRA